MEYRILGSTALEVSIVGFGGIPIMHVTEKEAAKAVNRAIDLGINYFHTAPTYGDSAAKIGNVVSERRNECILNVKIFGKTRETTSEQLQQALKMLKTDRLEIVQFRITETDFDHGIGQNGGLQVLLKAKEEGILDHIGITDHHPIFLCKAIEKNYFDNIIVPFNYVYNEAKEELIPSAKEKNIGITVMKPLGKGVLLNLEESLNYLWMNGVQSAIVGMKSAKEVEENVAVGNKPRPLTKLQGEQLRISRKELLSKYQIKSGALLPLGK